MGRLLVVVPEVEPQPASTARPVPDPLSTRRKRHNLAHRGERQALEASLPYRVTRARARGVSLENLWDTFRGRSARKSCGYSDTAPALGPFRNLMPASQTPARS